ncbi:MAG: dockerin type I domain-containing protein, partial [Planctomycetota bacterium]
SINGMLEELQIVGGDLIGDVLASGRIGRVNVQHDSESERGGIASGLIEARSIDSILIVGGDLLSTVRTTDPFHNDLRVVSTPVENRGGRITSRSSLHIAGGVQEIAGTEISLGLHAGGEVQNLTVTPRPDGQRGLLDADLNAHSFGQIRIIDGRLDASINPSAEEWEVTDGVVIDRIELTRTRWIDGGISLPSGTRIGMISSDGVAGHFDGVSDLVLPGFRLQPTIDGLSVTFDVLSTPYYNTVNRYDVNADGMASPLDALLVINALARGIPTQLPVDPPSGETPPFYDTSGDNLISPLDALQVINFLSRNAFTNGEGEYAALYQPLRRKAVNANDSVFQHWDDLEEEVLLKHF